MSGMKQAEIRIRLKTRTQLERIKRAAKLNDLSINKFSAKTLLEKVELVLAEQVETVAERLGE